MIKDLTGLIVSFTTSVMIPLVRTMATVKSYPEDSTIAYALQLGRVRIAKFIIVSTHLHVKTMGRAYQYRQA